MSNWNCVHENERTMQERASLITVYLLAWFFQLEFYTYSVHSQYIIETEEMKTTTKKTTEKYNGKCMSSSDLLYIAAGDIRP